MSRCTRLATGPIVAVAVALGSVLASGQVPVLSRGPELERLAFLEGAWEGKVTRHLGGDRTLTVAPAVTFSWSLGDAWLRGRDDTVLPDGTRIHNLVWITWNARAASYAGAWQDNVFPGVVTFRGRWLDDSTLELDTGDIELMGRAHRIVQTYRKASPGTFTTELHMSWDGKPLGLVGKGRFTRTGT